MHFLYLFWARVKARSELLSLNDPAFLNVILLSLCLAGSGESVAQAFIISYNF